jgi:hypothetical protein
VIFAKYILLNDGEPTQRASISMNAKSQEGGLGISQSVVEFCIHKCWTINIDTYPEDGGGARLLGFVIWGAKIVGGR